MKVEYLPLSNNFGNSVCSPPLFDKIAIKKTIVTTILKLNCCYALEK